jgi:hypothetical protein
MVVSKEIVIIIHFSAINKINQYLDLIKSYWNNVSIWS